MSVLNQNLKILSVFFPVECRPKIWEILRWIFKIKSKKQVTMPLYTLNMILNTKYLY